MSPPTSPALSAGVSGASTLANVTPRLLSSVKNESTPKNDLGFITVGVKPPLLIACRGELTAVKAAAPTKKTRRATTTHAIPLMGRQFRVDAGIAAEAAAGTLGPSKRTVSVYSATPSPSRDPQFRQKRRSD